MGRIDKRSTLMRPLGRSAHKNNNTWLKRNLNNHDKQRSQSKLKAQSKKALEVHNCTVDMEEAKTPTPLSPDFKKVVVEILRKLKKDEVESLVSISNQNTPPMRYRIQSTTEYVLYDFAECQRCEYVMVDRHSEVSDGDAYSAVLNGGYIYFVQWTGASPFSDLNIIPACSLKDYQAVSGTMSVELIRLNPWNDEMELFCEIETTATGSFLDTDFSGDFLYMVTRDRQEKHYTIISISATTRHIRELCRIHDEAVITFSVGRFGHLLIVTSQYLRVFDSTTMEWKLIIDLSMYPFQEIVCIQQTFDGSVYLIVRLKGGYMYDRHQYLLCCFPCVWNGFTSEPSWGSIKTIQRVTPKYTESYGICFPSMTSNVIHAPAFCTGVILDDEHFHKYVKMIRRIIDDCSRSHGAKFSLTTVLLVVISDYCFNIIKPAKVHVAPSRYLMPRRNNRWINRRQKNHRRMIRRWGNSRQKPAVGEIAFTMFGLEFFF